MRDTTLLMWRPISSARRSISQRRSSIPADDLAAGPVGAGAGADEDEDEDVDPTDTEIARDMLDFIEASPSMFHSAASICDWLDDAGFTYLPESTAWDLEPGGAYYTQRNGSSVIAWQVGEGVPVPAAGAQQADFRFADELDCPAYHFQVAASHADSPTFKVKAVSELDGAGESLRLNVEAYGGMIDYSWFDRPLGLAGRVLVREDVDEQGADGATGADGAADADAAVTPVAIRSRLLFIDRPVATSQASPSTWIARSTRASRPIARSISARCSPRASSRPARSTPSLPASWACVRIKCLRATCSW